MIERKACHRPRCNDEEVEILRKYRELKQKLHDTNSADGIDVACDISEISTKDCKHGWLKTDFASLFFKNPKYQEPNIDIDKIDWKQIISAVDDIKPYEVIPTQSNYSGIFDRLVYTDVHIGMKILANSQYGGKWDDKTLMRYLKQMIIFVKNNSDANTIIVDDLGDFMDGMGGKTVRKQHDLPQNMSDQEAFDCGLKFKLVLARALSGWYEHVIFHNICDDNHSGAFGYMVNSAFAAVAQEMFKNVEVTNYLQFVNHYTFKDNVFILCHGKDGKNMKFGFRPHITDKGIEKINYYIDLHYLRQPNGRIEFSKGDSHVELVDKAKPGRFEYWNYPAFCPASDWVQTNYTPKDHGFIFFNYIATNRYKLMPYYFNQ